MTETWIYPVICEERDLIKDSERWLDFLDEESSNKLPFRIFIQIPICSELCEFCPYYKEAMCDFSEDKLDKFVNSIIEELEYFSEKKYFQERKVSTICIGGGDPSSLPIKYWNKIFKSISNLFDLSELCGISMEGTVKNLLKPEYIDGLIENKVDRISFGIQTFDSKLKKTMNISVRNEEIYDLVERLKNSPITDYSFDMMYNMPNQSKELLFEDLNTAIKLKPQYIDIHGMDIYPDTSFFKKIYEGNYEIKPSRAREIEMYSQVSQFFENTEYSQVSSNLYSLKNEPFIGYKRYLRGYPMLGIGPSARSYVEKHSFRNANQIDQYINMIGITKNAVEYGHVSSDEDDDLRKMVFFPSMTWIDKSEIIGGENVEKTIKNLLECEYVRWEGSKLKLTNTGKIFAGNISRLFYSKEQKERDFINLLNMIRSQKTSNVKGEESE
ncbi:MAG: radical SAM protein [Eubacterium sp.]|nr:radical SAM protein [Eubacterium sp.]